MGSNPAGRASLIKGLQKCRLFSLAPTYLNRRYFLLPYRLNTSQAIHVADQVRSGHVRVFAHHLDRFLDCRAIAKHKAACPPAHASLPGFVPVYVRSTGESSPGIDALRGKGAIPWPNPQDADTFEGVFDVAAPTPVASPQTGLALFPSDGPPAMASTPQAASEIPPAIVAPTESAQVSPPNAESVQPTPDGASSVTQAPVDKAEAASSILTSVATPADTLFAAVRGVIQVLLETPMKDVEVATALEVSSAQAKAWLQRLVDEGVIEKQKKPAGYVIKQSSLFE